MADIELVIRIPEKDYLYIAKKHCLPSCDDKTLRKDFYEMILNGTPLPKGHGKIVDANRVLENGDNWEVETALMQTEAIIEADKTEDLGNDTEE